MILIVQLVRLDLSSTILPTCVNVPMGPISMTNNVSHVLEDANCVKMGRIVRPAVLLNTMLRIMIIYASVMLPKNGWTMTQRLPVSVLMDIMTN